MTGPDLIRPAADEYSTEMGNYIRLVPDGSLLAHLESQLAEVVRLIGTLNDDDALVQHAPYTWSIKQVIGHMIDSERVFGYRAMRLARNDATPLPGFDENAFMLHSDFDACPIADLLTEFESLRRSHVLMLRHFSAEAWTRRGVVNDHLVTARAMAHVLAGHAEHHARILQKRLGG